MSFLKRGLRSLPATLVRSKTRQQKTEEVLGEALDAERQAATRGMAEFQSKKANFRGTSPLLRRNIHRLEKGLCSPERRSVFAEAFIGETAKLYLALAAQPDASPNELRWASDVLSRYFDAVDTNQDKIAQAHALFLTAPAQRTAEGSFSPYPHSNIAAYVGRDLGATMDFPAFLALCRARRSQRWYADEPVAREKIEAAAAAALQAPSACNRQPFSFHCATRRDLIDKMAALPLGTAGFGDQLPALVCVVGDLSMFEEPRDRHLIFIDGALASMQFMLAITAQGLGSVPINWPDIPANHQAMRDLLGLAPHQVPIMLIGLGVPKPEGMIPYSAKRPVSEVLHFHG